MTSKLNGGHRQSIKNLVYSLLWPAECQSLHRLTWYFEASPKHTGLGNMARNVVAPTLYCWNSSVCSTNGFSYVSIFTRRHACLVGALKVIAPVLGHGRVYLTEGTHLSKLSWPLFCTGDNFLLKFSVWFRIVKQLDFRSKVKKLMANFLCV